MEKPEADQFTWGKTMLQWYSGHLNHRSYQVKGAPGKIAKGGEKSQKPGDRFLHQITKEKKRLGRYSSRDPLQPAEERKVLISAKCPEPAKISVDSTVLKKKKKTNIL